MSQGLLARIEAADLFFKDLFIDQSLPLVNISLLPMWKL